METDAMHLRFRYFVFLNICQKPSLVNVPSCSATYER